jgi:hypothetical protein
MIVIEPHIWATRLQKVGIMNLFDIPLFGRSKKMNDFIKNVIEFPAQGIHVAQQATFHQYRPDHVHYSFIIAGGGPLSFFLKRRMKNL